MPKTRKAEGIRKEPIGRLSKSNISGSRGKLLAAVPSVAREEPSSAVG